MDGQYEYFFIIELDHLYLNFENINNENFNY